MDEKIVRNLIANRECAARLAEEVASRHHAAAQRLRDTLSSSEDDTVGESE